ncbi:MAG: methyltransferase, partial [Flavobacteriales bacterium]|nr:methyltransferase [Flavobacteriales bacterium]
HAVEIDDRNAALAASKFARTPWRDRLHVHAMDIRRLRSAEPFDRIVSNPPFHDGTQRPLHDRRAVAKHGPDLSFPALIEVCDRLLSPTGRISLVLPLLRVKEIVSLAASNGLHPVRTFELCYVKDRPPKRALLELGRHPGLVDTGRLVVRGDSPLGYSPEVHRLLKDLLPAPTGSGRDLPLSE